MNDKHAQRLRISELQHNLVAEYVVRMNEKCLGKCALDNSDFESHHAKCWAEVLEIFSQDQSSDVIATQVLKQQISLKYLELKKVNGEKPTVSSVASGAVVGTATGVGVAAGGTLGAITIASTLALPTIVASGGLVLVGVAAVGLGVGVGFGVKNLVKRIQDKKNRKDATNSKKDSEKIN